MEYLLNGVHYKNQKEVWKYLTSREWKKTKDMIKYVNSLRTN